VDSSWVGAPPVSVVCAMLDVPSRPSVNKAEARTEKHVGSDSACDEGANDG